MRWSIILTFSSILLTNGCTTGSAPKRVNLPSPPACEKRPRIRDYCLGELFTGEDCMVCNNLRGCLDERHSAYCVSADLCEDPRCDSGTSPTQRKSGLLFE